MNLPTEKLYSLGRHKMFKCWKCSSSDPVLVGFIIFMLCHIGLVRDHDGHPVNQPCFSVFGIWCV